MSKFWYNNEYSIMVKVIVVILVNMNLLGFISAFINVFDYIMS